MKVVCLWLICVLCSFCSGALQNLDAAEVLGPLALLETNLSKATASAKGTPLGPCDTPVECEVCLGAICFTTDPSVWKPGKTMKRTLDAFWGAADGHKKFGFVQDWLITHLICLLFQPVPSDIFPKVWEIQMTFSRRLAQA